MGTPRTKVSYRITALLTLLVLLAAAIFFYLLMSGSASPPYADRSEWDTESSARMQEREDSVTVSDQSNLPQSGTLVDVPSTDMTEFYALDTPAWRAIRTNVDTSGWKTYRNEEYGFEIKYPPNTHLSYERTFPKETFLSVGIGFDPKEPAYGLQVELSPFQTIGDWFEWWENEVTRTKEYEGTGTISNRILSADNIVIDGVRGKVVLLSGLFPNWTAYFAAINEGLLYTLGYTATNRQSSEQRQRYIRQFHDIIATIRFLSPGDMAR